MAEAGQHREERSDGGSGRRGTPTRGLIDHILTARLLELYDPWRQFDLTKDMMKYCDWYIPKYREDIGDRDTRYDLGRINYFAVQLTAGKKLDPIVIDNQCDHGFIYPVPVLIDGHHRLCAADFVGAKKIPSSYSGRVDLLRYLKGLRKTQPQ